MRFECRLRILFAKAKQKDPAFTQGEFANKVGVSKAALSKLVNGKSLPSFEVAYKIAKEIDEPIEGIWIMVEEEMK